VLTSCGGYNKIMRGDDYTEKQKLADQFYKDEEWPRAAALYEQIYQRFSRSSVGEEAYYRLGKCTYQMEDYIMGVYYLASFPERFPGSQFAEEATFLAAMCSVKNSPEYSLDQTETEKALIDLQNFIDNFPLSNLVDSCNHIMDRLHAKLELKKYKGAMQYYKMENYRATVAAFDAFLEEYPYSEHKEEIMFLAIKTEYLLAVNSIEAKKEERFDDTIKRYRTFANIFPESEKIKEAEKYKEKAEKALEIYK
jgi:outer membrane protein assembly factor BamD